MYIITSVFNILGIIGAIVLFSALLNMFFTKSY